MRAILLYVIYLFFTRIFNARVRFRSGYSFFSIQDISVDSDEFEITCKLFMISVGVHTNMKLRNLQIKKGHISNLKDVYLDAQRIVDRALPSKRFFHISIDVDIIDYHSEYLTLTMEDIHSIHTDSQHSFSYRNCTFSSLEVSGKISEYRHSIHFSGDLPEKVQIVRPMFNLKCDTNTISSEHLEISAYSEVPSIWRTAISLQAIELTFPNFVFLNDIFIIKFSRQITISITDSRVTFESLHIKNILHQFKIKINEVKLSHDKIKIKKIIGNSHVQFLRILNHLRWLLYASCKIKKIELLIKLDNGELCDIVVLNFEERNKIDNENEKNENRRLSDIDEDSEVNHRYINLFNKYFNSLNKHNIQLSEGEALITNPNDITNVIHPNDMHNNRIGIIFNRSKKEFAKADEVKMEMVAHRTLISSVHMSNIQINRVNVSQFSLDTLNIIYSNSETFQLYCQELYTGFSGKLTARDHNIQALVKSLRIDELILNKSLTCDNLKLKLLINKSVPLEESRKSLKSLFPKLADPSKIQSVILLDFDIKCSDMNYTNSLTATPIHFSGNLALFHNGSKLLTCGVVHCISEKASIPLEAFFSPAFWYISFETNTLKIKYENKKAVFKSIKGEATAFTFESAALYRDIIQPKRQRNLHSTTSSNLNNEMNTNNEDYQYSDNKSISIFDFWTEDVIPISVGPKIRRHTNSNLTSQFSLTNDSSNSLVIGSNNTNLTSDTNLNLNFNPNVNSYSNLPVFNPKPRKNASQSINFSRQSKRVSSQFDFEDSVFRPSQHYEMQSIFASKDRFSNQSFNNQQRNLPNMQRNSVFISPKLTSEYVTGSLFESSASLISLISNQSTLGKKTKVSSFDNDIDDEYDVDNSPLAEGIKHESSLNIQIDELKNDSPFYETVRYKFECFNGEYFTNSSEKEKTVEFKFEKAIFGDIQYTNVTSKFVNQEAKTFSADQIEWPYMKAFFADFKLPERRFIAKSMSLNSNFMITTFDFKLLGFKEAEIGQILFKEISLDRNLLKNMNQDNFSSSMKSPLVNLKSEKVTMNKGKFSFCATEVSIPITSSKTDISANKVRVIFSTVSSLISFLVDMKPQFKKISSKILILKLRPTFLRINNINKNYLNHSIVFYNSEFSFTPLKDPLNVFDISSDVVTIFRVSKKVEPLKSDVKEDVNNNQKVQNNDNTNNNKKDKNRDKVEIFASRPDEEKDQSSLTKDEKDKFHITLTFNEKERICPRFNISLNSKVMIKCGPKDAVLFKDAFEAIFMPSPHEEIKKYVFESTSFLRLTLILNYYNPKNADFDELRKYVLDIRPIELHKQTKTFHDMLRYVFESVLKSVKVKVAEKKREMQLNGNNYS